MDKLIGRSVVVSGRVQGVFYRASTRDEAKRLDLRGWVKNLPGGEVYIEVFGEDDKVRKLISWCKQGPPMADVIDLSVKEIDFREEAPFRIVY